MISHIHEKNQWMLSYRFMTMNMGSMINGNREIPTSEIFKEYLMSSDNMRMDMHMLMAMYGLSNNLTLMTMLHYNYNKMSMRMLDGTHHHHGGEAEQSNSHMKTSGFGDIKVSALYGIINKGNHQLIISGGISIPLGSIQIKGSALSMYNGIHFPYMMQLGSGTWDVNNTLSYLHHTNDISWSSQLSSVIRPGKNSLGYRLGNELTFNNWLAYQWARSFSSSIRVEGQALGKIKGEDKTLYKGYEPAANPINYGGRKAFAYLGTTVFLRGGLLNGQRLAVEAGLPFYQYLNGPQMKSKATIFATWSIVF
jgi:hypothetical protein